MVILRGICKCRSAGPCPRFLSPLSPAQLIACMAEGCSKMGLKSWECLIKPLSLQTLRQAVPSLLSILNSSALILHGIKELMCLPEGNVFARLLKGRGMWYKGSSRGVYSKFLLGRGDRMSIFITVEVSLMQRGPDLSAPTSKAFPIQAMQNPDITQKMKYKSRVGSIKAQAVCSGGIFLGLSPQWG